MAFVVQIERIIPGGRGLGFLQGKPVFVPYSAPRDHIAVKGYRDHGSYIEAHNTEVIEPSSCRTIPPCIYFGYCGGCNLQQVDYQAQLLAKRDILLDTLQRVGKINFLPDHISLTPSPPWSYRNRLQLKIDPRGNKISWGFHRTESHEIVALEECLIISQSLWRIVSQLRSKVETCSTLIPFLSGCQIFEGCDKRYLVNLELKADDSGVESLRKVVLESSWCFDNAEVRLSFSSSTGRIVAVSGPTYVHKTVGSSRYRVSQGSFFQVNDFLLENLRSMGVGVSTGKLALDLYCGVGFFTLALATKFDRVMAVENHPICRQDLLCNLEENGALGCQVFPLEVSIFLENYKRSLDSVDFILLDPPRAGASLETVKKVASLHATEVVYVSCDPATLARDLKVFVGFGYEIASLDILDLFPQTHHLETVARLRNR